MMVLLHYAKTKSINLVVHSLRTTDFFNNSETSATDRKPICLWRTINPIPGNPKPKARTTATNFTVILYQRQPFGIEPGTFNDIDPNVPFVVPTKSFSFDCSGVNSSETAFLMFQSRDVCHQINVFQINGVDAVWRVTR